MGLPFPKDSCEDWVFWWLVSQLDIHFISICYLFWAPGTGGEVGVGVGAPPGRQILECERGQVTLGPQSSGTAVAWETNMLPSGKVALRSHS